MKKGTGKGMAFWELLNGTWQLRTPNSRRVPLNVLELDLLRRLFAVPRELVTHGELMTELSPMGEAMSKHRLEMLVHRLRKKVERETGEALPLTAVRGLGYAMADAPRVRTDASAQNGRRSA
jgi:DNA-binding response OmpR family regulator